MKFGDKKINLDNLDTLAAFEAVEAGGVDVVPKRYPDGTSEPDTMHVEIKPRGFYVPAGEAINFLRVVADTVTAEDVKAVVSEMIAGAKDGDVKKQALLMKYVIGERNVKDLTRVT